MNDQPDAQNSTQQQTAVTRDKHPCPWWDLNPKSQLANGHRFAS